MAYAFGELLSGFLRRGKMTQGELANTLDVHRNTVSAGARSEYLPETRESVLQIAQELGLTKEETDGLLREARFPLEYGTLESTLSSEAEHARFEALPVGTVPQRTDLPPVHRMERRPYPFFTGREQNLIGLAQAIKGGGSAATVITGLGGTGKTILAIEFAHRYGQYFPGGVFWLSFSDPASVATEVVACGGIGAMNIPGFGALDLDNQVRRVKQEWRRTTPRLLILDNCDSEELLNEWLPSSGGCRVLVTSRRANWTPDLGVKLLRLDVLSRAESVALLRQFRPDFQIQDPNLDAIASELGDMPLALHLAGSYLSHYQGVATLTLQGYLSQLRSIQELPISLPSLPPSTASAQDYSYQIDRTFNLSHAKLDLNDPTDRLANRILPRAACFALGEPIPRTLLLLTLTLPNETSAEIQAEDALVRLVNLGLLEQTGERGELKLHRLIAKFAKKLTEDVDLSAVEQAVQIMLDQIRNLQHVAQGRLFIPHLRAVVDAAIQRQDISAALLATLLGYDLQLIGDYRGAALYFGHALQIRRKVAGPFHPDTATSLNNLGFALQEQGKLLEALPYYKRALAIREHILEEMHADTASSLNNLGYFSQARGDYHKARRYFERALNIRLKVLGPNHTDTANSYNNFGYVLQALNQL